MNRILLVALSLLTAVAPLAAQDPPEKKHRKNRLAREKSPYLKQHEDNPVDWWPWCDEAFAEAKKRNVPVFLSIGYSTCHWCHVMEHESFESEAMAKYMNQHFVCIKVDREERPDVDQIYMRAVQIFTNGRGGWPASLWMTADKEPFWGGTYYPPEAFRQILENVTRLWKENPEALIKDGSRVLRGLAELSRRKAAKDLPAVTAIKKAADSLSDRFDDVHGGFTQGAPKFPRTSVHEMLLLAAHRTGDSVLAKHALFSLRKMAHGGIYDHLAGGFHRYSTDRKWLVPHFEKMLYDQALIARTYVEAALYAGDPFFADVAEDILNCVLSDFAAPGGGFISAYDADSGGKEGTYYIWRREELKKLLDKSTFAVLDARFDLPAKGNWHEYEKAIILEVKAHWKDVAAAVKLPEKACRDLFEKSRPLLVKTRNTRPRPGADTKVLTDWNGLTISAFARAGFVCKRPDFIATAQKTATHILKTMRRKDGTLFHRSCDGEVAVDGVLTDYAYLIEGLLDLFESDGDVRWVVEAEELANVVQRQFVDAAGAFFDAPIQATDLPVRLKDLYDGARPSGNSIHCRNLLRLADLTGKRAFEKTARISLKYFRPEIEGAPHAYPAMLRGLDAAHRGLREIVVLGTPGGGWESLAGIVRRTWFANAVVCIMPDDSARIGADRVPLLSKRVGGAKGTAWVCENGVCQSPTSDPTEFEALLSN